MTGNPNQPGSATESATVPRGLPIRVVIADDQALIRRGLAVMLGADAAIEIVGEAADGLAALELCRRLHPDIVLMDLIMPRLGGVAATRALAGELPRTQVVVLTTFDTDDLVFDAIRAGAQAYLLKDESEAELLDTIHAVHRGESKLDANIARKLLQEFRRLRSPVGDGGTGETDAGAPAVAETSARPAHRLTRREEQILDLIAQGMSNKEIGRKVNLAEGTVKNYVSRIMEKLHARSRTELAVRAIGDRKS